MKISAKHLKRDKEIGLLLWKYGRSDLAQQMGIAEAVDRHELINIFVQDQKGCKKLRGFEQE